MFAKYRIKFSNFINYCGEVTEMYTPQKRLFLFIYRDLNYCYSLEDAQKVISQNKALDLARKTAKKYVY